MEKATKADYEFVQGGMPSVKIDGKITTIHHNYPDGEGMIVRSHKSIEDYGDAYIEVRGKVKAFKVALLRMFHGKPCEQESLKAGGSGYDRNMSSD